MKQKDFEGKLAVVTGGSSGIGLAIARELGSRGAFIGICGRSGEKLRRALEELKTVGILAYGAVCDVSGREQTFRFADEVADHFGKSIDIWVCNAGIYPQRKIVDTDEDTWNRTVDTNLKSVYLGALVADQRMGPGGVLINASSFAAAIPSVGSGVYAATKAGISSMTRTLAAELAPKGIRVVAYMPGVVATEMTMPAIEKAEKSMVQSIALHRFGTGEEIARTVAFLASPDASYITGTTVEISGGKFCVQNPATAWE